MCAADVPGVLLVRIRILPPVPPLPPLSERAVMSRKKRKSILGLLLLDIRPRRRLTGSRRELAVAEELAGLLPSLLRARCARVRATPASAEPPRASSSDCEGDWARRRKLARLFVPRRSPASLLLLARLDLLPPWRSARPFSSISRCHSPKSTSSARISLFLRRLGLLLSLGLRLFLGLLLFLFLRLFSALFLFLGHPSPRRFLRTTRICDAKPWDAATNLGSAKSKAGSYAIRIGDFFFFVVVAIVAPPPQAPPFPASRPGRCCPARCCTSPASRTRARRRIPPPAPAATSSRKSRASRGGSGAVAGAGAGGDRGGGGAKAAGRGAGSERRSDPHAPPAHSASALVAAMNPRRRRTRPWRR